MVVIKGMDMPMGCWNCGCTCENRSGATVCVFTRKPLYPMGGGDERDEDYPLAEILEAGEMKCQSGGKKQR